MHFIFDLIRKILRGKLYGEEVVLWGDGEQRRELVLVEDFARIALRLAERTENDLINVGAGREYSIRDFARMICERVGYDFAQVRFDTSRYVGARSKCLAVKKLHRLLGNVPLTPLEQGLDATIAWFLSERQSLLAANALARRVA